MSSTAFQDRPRDGLSQKPPAATARLEKSDGEDNNGSSSNSNHKKVSPAKKKDPSPSKFIQIMTTLTPLFLLLFGILTLKVLAGTNVKPKFNWKDQKFVYAFGDSYTFVQGSEGHANFSFIGDAFTPGFSPEALLSNEIVPKNTSSDGSNWIEFLTGCLSGKPSDCSEHQLWDFAFAGADIDSKLLPLHHNFTVPLWGQVQQWFNYASKVLPHPAKNTLTFWWIGINDTGDTVNNATITDFNAFWTQEMTSYFRAVEYAYTRGLEGTHVFINVPPEHRSPSWINNPTGAAKLESNTLLFNQILSTYVEQFTARHTTSNVFTFDAYSWFNEVLDNAGDYGFKNITGFCECKDDSFFWYDSGHPTEHVHSLLAQAIEKQLLDSSL